MEEPKVVNLTVDKDGVAHEESKWKTRFHAAKEWAKRKMSGAWNWCCDNKGDLIVLIPLGIAAARGIKNTVSTPKSAAQIERERIERSYYDRKTGIYWTLKRPMRTWEKEELVRRMRNGEGADEVLRDFRILD